MARLTIVTVVVAAAAFLLVFELLRRRRLRQKYAFLWVLVAGVTVVLSVFPALLQRASGLLGIAVPSNLLFLVSLVILFGVSLQLSIEVGVLEEQSRRLAEEVGAIRLRLEDIEGRSRPSHGVRGEPLFTSGETPAEAAIVGGSEAPEASVDSQPFLRHRP